MVVSFVDIGGIVEHYCLILGDPECFLLMSVIYQNTVRQLYLNSYLSSGTSPIVAVKSTGRMMIKISQQRYQPSDNNKNVDV